MTDNRAQRHQKRHRHQPRLQLSPRATVAQFQFAKRARSYLGHCAWTKTRCCSPRSRAAGVTMVRSPMTILRRASTPAERPLRRRNRSALVYRRSPAGTGWADVLLDARGGAWLPPCRARYGAPDESPRTPRNSSIRRASTSAEMPVRAAAPVAAAAAARCARAARGGPHERLDGRDTRARAGAGFRTTAGVDFVGQPLDVQQVPRRDVVGRDVAAVAAAAERHRRIEPGRQPDRPVRRRRVDDDAEGRLLQAELEDDLRRSASGSTWCGPCRRSAGSACSARSPRASP